MSLLGMVVGSAVKDFLGTTLKDTMKTEQWKRIVSACSKINVRFGDHEFKTSRYFELRDIIQKDSKSIYAFQCTEKNRGSYHLERLALGCNYSHAGLIVVGITKDDLTCIHIDNTGLRIEHVLDVLDKCDKFSVLKLPIPEHKLNDAREKIIDIIDCQRKYVYDTEFDLDNDKGEKPSDEKRILSYCSELVLDFGRDLVEDPDFAPHYKLGVKFFSPDDLSKCGTQVFS